MKPITYYLRFVYAIVLALLTTTLNIMLITSVRDINYLPIIVLTALCLFAVITILYGDRFTINIIRNIKLYFSESKYIESKAKRLIKLYFEGYDGRKFSISQIDIVYLGITNIKVNNSKYKIVVTITLERPGLLIGKQGKEIDNLTEYLSMHLDKPVVILVEESKLWN